MTSHTSTKTVLLDLCSACACKCRYCLTQHGGHRAAEIMQWQTYTRIVDILRRENYAKLYLYFTGEPLLHPQFANCLEYAIRSNFTRVQVATKLQAMPNWPAIGMAMQQSTGCVTEWLVGVDGITPEVLRQTCTGAKLELLSTNLMFLSVVSVDRKSDLIATTVVTEFTKPHLDNIRQCCERLGYRWQPRDLGTLNTDLATDDDKAWYRKAVPNGNPRLYSYLSNGMPASRRTHPCSDLLEPCIHPNGDVSVCCHDQLGRGIVGNVIDANSLDAVMASEPAREMYTLCRNMQAPFCVGCS